MNKTKKAAKEAAKSKVVVAIFTDEDAPPVSYNEVVIDLNGKAIAKFTKSSIIESAIVRRTPTIVTESL